MNYLLVKPEELDEQGYDYKYAERIPDGRVILPLKSKRRAAFMILPKKMRATIVKNR